MPWVTYLSIIVRIFRVDPGKGQTPRDPLAVEKADPAELIAMAQRRLKERTPLTKGKCDLWLLNAEALIKMVFTCRTSKFGKIFNQGRSQIRRELNLFHFLKTQREVQATFNAITPMNKRRLIKRAVRAGLLVTPMRKVPHEHSIKGKNWDTDQEETSSEEDFDYLKWELEETGTLPPNTMKLLRGVVQMPFKDRKNPERYER